MRIRHVLITMFNRRLGGRGPFKPGLELDDEWLRYRWALFTTYTMPSIGAQSEQDFTWHVLCNPETPEWFRLLTAEVDTPANLAFSFRLDDPDLESSVDPSADAVLVTRIDSDDAFHRTAMERIREDCSSDPYTSEIVTVSDGYLLHHETGRMRPLYSASPSFSTKINLAPDLSPLNMGGAHHRLRQRYASRSISEGTPLFVVVTHDEHHRKRNFREDDGLTWMSRQQTRETLDREFGIHLQGRPRRAEKSSIGSGGRPVATSAPRVAVSVPCFEAWDTLPRAVESVLSQTYRDVLVVVTNDGDPEARWDVLDSFDDPRLIRFDLQVNRGRYFADQLVLMARLGQFLLIQDADDWSEPSRIEALLREMRQNHAVAAVSSHFQHREEAPPVVFKTRLASSTPTSLYLDGVARPLRSTYYGLFDAAELLKVGGCYAGFRMGYDTFVLHLLAMVGSVAWIDEPLYHREVRADSLTTSDVTGLYSSARRLVTEELSERYQEAYHTYCEYLGGRISASVLASQLRALAWRSLRNSEWQALREESERLRWQVRMAIGEGELAAVTPR
jgi:glycosyltransferase involved in cell wall biosynthesis